MTEFSDYEITVLTKMWHKPAIAGNYKPQEILLSGISKEHRDKGKQALQDLEKKGIIGFKQGKDAKLTGIRSGQVERVREILRDEVPDYVLELR